MTNRYISYLRVSTVRQGQSGLGLEAQRDAVRPFLQDCGGVLHNEYIEVESGKKTNRPKLDEALRECRVHNAILIVAKVDRLTRSVSFLHRLLDSGVEVSFCDLPQISGPTGKFMLNQMAAVAELEAGLISQRTKAALASAKKRGVKLGGNRGNIQKHSREGALRSSQVRSEQSKKRAHDLLPTIQNMSCTSASEIARELNNLGIRTPRGGNWQATQVIRLQNRISSLYSVT